MGTNLDNIRRDEISNKNSDAVHAEITDMFYRYFLPTMLGIEVEHNEPEDDMIPVDFKEVIDQDD